VSVRFRFFFFFFFMSVLLKHNQSEAMCLSEMGRVKFCVACAARVFKERSRLLANAMKQKQLIQRYKLLS